MKRSVALNWLEVLLALVMLTPSPAFALTTEGAGAVLPYVERPISIDEVPLAEPRSLADIANASGPIDGGAFFSISRWDRFPKVIVLDMEDFSAQNRMFSRLAFFLEKSGYRGRLLSDYELSDLHGWNAHDYGPSGLASFFNTANKRRFELDKEELLLRDLAMREGLIVREGKNYSPGSGAILSISRESDRYARRLLLAHESYHGIFFTVSAYRQLSYSVWDATDKNERAFVLRLLTYLGYDTTSRELTVNEFQAYLLQQPASMLSDYVDRMEPILAKNPNFVSPPVADALPGLLRDEKKLETFLRQKYRIGAGGTYTGVHQPRGKGGFPPNTRRSKDAFGSIP